MVSVSAQLKSRNISVGVGSTARIMQISKIKNTTNQNTKNQNTREMPKLNSKGEPLRISPLFRIAEKYILEGGLNSSSSMKKYLNVDRRRWMFFRQTLRNLATRNGNVVTDAEFRSMIARAFEITKFYSFRPKNMKSGGQYRIRSFAPDWLPEPLGTAVRLKFRDFFLKGPKSFPLSLPSGVNGICKISGLGVNWDFGLNGFKIAFFPNKNVLSKDDSEILNSRHLSDVDDFLTGSFGYFGFGLEASGNPKKAIVVTVQKRKMAYAVSKGAQELFTDWEVGVLTTLEKILKSKGIEKLVVVNSGAYIHLNKPAIVINEYQKMDSNLNRMGFLDCKGVLEYGGTPDSPEIKGVSLPFSVRKLE